MLALDGIEEGKAIDQHSKSMTIATGTLARMAGNIAAGLVAPKVQYGADYDSPPHIVAQRAIEIAQEIVKQLGMTVEEHK